MQTARTLGSLVSSQGEPRPFHRMWRPARVKHGEVLAVPQNRAEGLQEFEPQDEVELAKTEAETADGKLLGADGQGDVTG